MHSQSVFAAPSLNLANLFEDNRVRCWGQGLRDALTPEGSGKKIVVLVNSLTTVGLFHVTLPPDYYLADVLPKVSSISKEAPLAWVNRIVKFSLEGMEDAALKEIAVVTTRLKGSAEESQISSGFSQLMSHQLPDIVAIALLRNVFSIRGRVAGWNLFLEITESRLRERGKEPKKLLRGLL